MYSIRIAVICAAIATFAGPVAGQTDSSNRSAAAERADARRDRDVRAVPSLRTRRVASAPAIDGRLDDAAWDGAEVATGFTQLSPSPGQPASQRTEVRVLHDDEAIYVAARLYDTAPDSVVAQLGRRDSGVYSDWFYVALDSYFDRRTAFVFGLNPRGVQQDALLHGDVEQDGSWDAVWEGAAARDEQGWTAEFRIPLSQLRFAGADGCSGGDGGPAPDGEDACGEVVWGLNFMRAIARHGEESFWAPTLPDEGRVVSAFGELRGLGTLAPPRRLEIMPYVVARARSAPGYDANPLYGSIDRFGGMGADVKAGVTSNLTLTATLNPDFGQVEADPSVVNLTASETFFSEKRPFFVEGVDIFRFGLGLGDGDMGNESLFYSRRIGRPPQGGVAGEHVRAPDATTILGAAKLSGKTAGGWSVGVLSAVTASEHADFIQGGERGEAPVEPLTSYAVARVMKDFRAGRSAVGGIVTATNRSLPETGELDWLRRSAYTGGADVRHRFAGDAYQLSGTLVASHIAGTPEAIHQIQTSPVHYFQRPDADHLDYDPARTSMTGVAGKATLGKLQGNLRFQLFALTASPEFEANDLGFQSNADVTMGGAWVGYESNEPGPLFRRWNVGTNAWGGRTYGGENVGLGGNVNGGFQLNSFWTGHGGINVNAPAYSPSLLRGGPAFLRPGQWSLWSSLNSDRRKPVQLSIRVNASGQAETEGGSLSVSPGVDVRPAHNVDLYLGPSLSRNQNVTQYVARAEVAGQPTWLLGTVEQTTAALTARLNYTFSPTLSLQLYAQPFISAGAYADFKRVTDPRADAFADRVHVLTDAEITSEAEGGVLRHAVDLDGDGAADFEFQDPGFNFKQLRSNVVLRWEYRPGSSLFLVWSQGRTDFTRDARFRFREDVGDLWSAAGTNVLMLKASYWFGL
ncbi:MAG TPA: DUF5916 domain-containing protein [Longimicrobiales bacterium]|nr:DUF5916 domain-containing protein [Longimicrobiales bacterium]